MSRRNNSKKTFNFYKLCNLVLVSKGIQPSEDAQKPSEEQQKAALAKIKRLGGEEVVKNKIDMYAYRYRKTVGIDETHPIKFNSYITTYQYYTDNYGEKKLLNAGETPTYIKSKYYNSYLKNNIGGVSKFPYEGEIIDTTGDTHKLDYTLYVKNPHIHHNLISDNVGFDNNNMITFDKINNVYIDRFGVNPCTGEYSDITTSSSYLLISNGNHDITSLENKRICYIDKDLIDGSTYLNINNTQTYSLCVYNGTSKLTTYSTIIPVPYNTETGKWSNTQNINGIPYNFGTVCDKLNITKQVQSSKKAWNNNQYLKKRIQRLYRKIVSGKVFVVNDGHIIEKYGDIKKTFEYFNIDDNKKMILNTYQYLISNKYGYDINKAFFIKENPNDNVILKFTNNCYINYDDISTIPSMLDNHNIQKINININNQGIYNFTTKSSYLSIKNHTCLPETLTVRSYFISPPLLGKANIVKDVELEYYINNKLLTSVNSKIIATFFNKGDKDAKFIYTYFTGSNIVVNANKLVTSYNITVDDKPYTVKLPEYTVYTANNNGEVLTITNSYCELKQNDFCSYTNTYGYIMGGTQLQHINYITWNPIYNDCKYVFKDKDGKIQKNIYTYDETGQIYLYNNVIIKGMPSMLTPISQDELDGAIIHLQLPGSYTLGIYEGGIRAIKYGKNSYYKWDIDSTIELTPQQYSSSKSYMKYNLKNGGEFGTINNKLLSSSYLPCDVKL